MSGVRVTVDASPRLLDDLLRSLLRGPGVELRDRLDPTTEVAVVTAERLAAAVTRIVVIVGERLAAPVTVVVDGRQAHCPPTPAAELRALVIDLARSLPRASC